MKKKTNVRSLILKELLVPFLAVLSILIIAFFGYIILEGLTPLESLYLMVITFATIGYGDVVPITDAGRIFTICIIISGFTVGLYAIGKISAFFVEGELSKLLKQRKMNKVLDSMKDHYIVCGYGKTGKRVLDDLLNKGLEVVIIESNAERNEKIKEIYSNKFIHLDGDATTDEILLQAGIKRAKILISVLSTDAENLFVTLSAKDLNKEIKVITRVAETNSGEKLRKAGADLLFLPSKLQLTELFLLPLQVLIFLVSWNLQGEKKN